MPALLQTHVPPELLVTFTADADLTGKEGLSVTCDGVSADGRVKLPDAAGEELVGVLHQGGAEGASVVVAVPAPIVPAIAGGAVTRGKRVMQDATDFGKHVDAAGGAAGLKGTTGIAVTTATDGQTFSLLLAPASNYYGA